MAHRKFRKLVNSLARPTQKGRTRSPSTASSPDKAMGRGDALRAEQKTAHLDHHRDFALRLFARAVSGLRWRPGRSCASLPRNVEWWRLCALQPLTRSPIVLSVRPEGGIFVIGVTLTIPLRQRAFGTSPIVPVLFASGLSRRGTYRIFQPAGHNNRRDPTPKKKPRRGNRLRGFEVMGATMGNAPNVESIRSSTGRKDPNRKGGSSRGPPGPGIRFTKSKLADALSTPGGC